MRHEKLPQADLRRLVLRERGAEACGCKKLYALLSAGRSSSIRDGTRPSHSTVLSICGAEADHVLSNPGGTRPGAMHR